RSAAASGQNIAAVCWGDALGWDGRFVGGGGVLTSGRGVLATGRRSQRATRRGRADACTACRRCLNECREPPNWVLRRFASVPVTGVRSLLDWASTTVAPPISDIANRTVPKIFLIVEFLRLLFLRQRLNLLDPRVGNATRVLLLRGWLSSIVRTRLGDQCMLRRCVARGLLRVGGCAALYHCMGPHIGAFCAPGHYGYGQSDQVTSLARAC